MATFRPRGLCGRRYPRQRPHCSVELKRIVAERGRRSRGGHLYIVWCAFQVRTKSPSRLCWWPPSFLPRLEQTSTIGLVWSTCFFSFRLPPLLLRLESATSRARMTETVCRSLWRPTWRTFLVSNYYYYYYGYYYTHVGILSWNWIFSCV